MSPRTQDGQFVRDHWPPEADLAVIDLARFGILKIWQANLCPELRPEVRQSWHKSSAAFPRWVDAIWQAQLYKPRKINCKYPGGGSKRVYADEVEANPLLAKALTEGLEAVFALARLSPGESAVMLEVTAGHEQTVMARRLGCKRQSVQTLKDRALAKLRGLVLPIPLVSSPPTERRTEGAPFVVPALPMPINNLLGEPPMPLSRRQLAGYGLSVADLARLASISYGRVYYYVTGAQNLTETEQRRITEVIAVAIGNAHRLDAVSGAVTA